MTQSAVTSKSLRNMPPAARASTFQASDRFLAAVFRKVFDSLFEVLAWAIYLAPAVFVTWLVGFLALGNTQGLRLLTTAFLGLLFALCVVFHLLELFMAVPWGARGYPVLLADSLVRGLLSRAYGGLPLAATTAIFAGLLWLTWWNGWQDQAGATNTLAYAIANSALAATMYLYGRFPPYYLFTAPSAEDKAWLRAGGAKRHSAAASQETPAQAGVAQAEPEYATPVHAQAPRTTFKDIFGMAAVKERLLDPSRAVLAARQPGAESPPNGILMFGGPGNGKTGFAEALAGELGVPMVTLTYGDVASKWIGEMPRLIMNSFAYAKANAPCLLFIDEIDSFLRSRDSGSNNSEDLKITNTLLTQIVELRQHQVVLVAATNYLANLDAAAIREGRFDFKVEITPPDEPARIGLLQKAAQKYGRGLEVDEGALLSVAKRWNGFSVSRLLAVGKELPKYAREKGVSRIGFDDWMAALRLVQGRKGQPPAETKPLKDLILDANTRDALDLIAGRLKDAEHIESMGGTLPSGILFHGPSGTGKTAAARALALDCKWAFLSVAGPELIADREKMNKLYAEAMDIRPALVFIDEADDVLRNRQFTSTPDIVNRMLALMDGAGEKVKDVVFIAATNHPDQVDPALVRAGRFTEKVEFFLPPADQVPRAVAGWLKAKRVALEPDNDAFEVAELVAGQSMANIEGILQYALNRAIPRTAKGGTVVLTREDLGAGLRVVSTSESSFG